MPTPVRPGVKSLATPRRSAAGCWIVRARHRRWPGRVRRDGNTPVHGRYLSGNGRGKHYGRKTFCRPLTHVHTDTRTRAHSGSARRGYGPLCKVLTRLITLIDPCDQLLLLLRGPLLLLLLPLLFCASKTLRNATATTVITDTLLLSENRQTSTAVLPLSAITGGGEGVPSESRF